MDMPGEEAWATTGTLDDPAGRQMELILSRLAIGQLLKGKEEAEEKAEKATTDLER